MMKSLQFIADYKENARYRHSFNQLAQEVFGIDFEKWYQAGFWNDRYICYSYVDDTKVVANVSVNLVELVLHGERKRAVQIGTVMTHPDYRKQGLASRLMATVLAEYEKRSEVMYLFPEEKAVNFYCQFGFTVFQDGRFILEGDPKMVGQGVARKLNIFQAEDRQRFSRLASERVTLSRVFSVDQAQGILAWYSVGMLADCIYDLEDLDAVVIARENQGVLQIFDVLSRERLPFREILQRVCSGRISKVVFHFTPDFVDMGLEQMSFEPNEMVLFKPEIKLPERWAHPLTAHA